MKKQQAILLFVVLALLAWAFSYGPGIYHRHETLAALDKRGARWVCVINTDAVSSDYQGYITRKYILLGGQRYYSDEFRQWGHGADYILLIIEDDQRLHWMRLAFSEASALAVRFGLGRVGCRHMDGGTMEANTLPVTPPVHVEGTHGAPSSPTYVLAHPQDFNPRPDVYPNGYPPEIGTTLQHAAQRPVPLPVSAPAPQSAAAHGYAPGFTWQKALQPMLNKR
ncbi:MAG TPA: hypothetical protein VHB73_00730 [Alphaproteobacteria bacterium]|nr:hypothetical protein [Alphaproteobacteria bacterium]